MRILTHPDLDDTIIVPDGSAAVLCDSGWRDAPAAEAAAAVGDDTDLAADVLASEKAGADRKTVKTRLARKAGQ